MAGEFERLLAEMSGGFAIDPRAMQAIGEGMSRTTLGQLTDPSIVFGTGGLTEDQLASLLTQYLASSEEQLLGEVEKEYLKSLEDWNNKQAALELKYVVEEPKFYDDSYTSTLQRFGGDPVVQSVMDSLIGSGTQSPLTVGQAQRKMQSELDADGWVRYGFDPETAQYFINNGVTSVDEYLRSPIGANMSPEMAEEFKNDTLKSVGGAASDFRTEYAEWERGNESRARQYQAELRILGEQPQPEAVPFDVEAERRKFFKEIGLEGLALLPDPSVPYNITAEQIRATKPTTNAFKALEQYAQDPSSGLGRMLDLQESIRTGTSIQPDLTGMDLSGAEAAMMAVPEFDEAQARAELIRLKRTGAGGALEKAQGETAYANKLARYMNKQLSEAGRTPFSDAMKRQYGYGGVA
jgi:hypothetical protein